MDIRFNQTRASVRAGSPVKQKKKTMDGSTVIDFQNPF